MSEIGVEGLSILELAFLRNDNLILRNAVVGIVAIDRLDRTYPSVFLDHLIHGREREVITLIQRSVYSCSCLQLLIEFRTSLLQVGLRHIKHIVNLQFRIYVILLASLLGHQAVVIVFDFLSCLLVHNGESRDENRKTLLAFEDCHLGQSFTIVVLNLLSFSLLVLIEVQTGHSVEGAEHRQLISLFLTVHDEHQGIHAVILTP